MTPLRTLTFIGATCASLAATVLLAGPTNAATPNAATPHAVISGDGNATLSPHYVGGPAANDLRVSVISKGPEPMTSYVVLRDRVAIDIAKGTVACSYPTAADHRTVRCVTSFDEATEPVLRADLGAGNDAGSVAANGITTTFSGGPGNDRLVASGYVDIVHGDAGNDRITATSGNAIGLYGDAGNDTIIGSQQRDKIYGGRGNDTVRANKGPDTIFGNSGNDTLYGNSGNDTISGGPGRDKISGGPGRNKIKQ